MTKIALRPLVASRAPVRQAPVTVVPARPPAPVLVKAVPPAPVIVPAGGRTSAVAVLPVRPAMTTAAALASRRVLAWRVIGPGKVRGLGATDAPSTVPVPSPASLSMMLSAGTYFLDSAIDAARPLLAWGLAGAELCYERGGRPSDLWGALLSKELAAITLKVGGLMYLRQQLAKGDMSWLIVGDRLAVVRTIDLPAPVPVPGSMGWIPDAYVTGRPMAHGEHATQLDSLGFTSGAFVLSSVIAGTEAAAAAVIESGGATAAEVAAETSARVPSVIVAAGAGASPSAAAGAARAVGGFFGTLANTVARTFDIRWVLGIAIALKLPDAINAFRSGNTRATEAGTDAAGRTLQKGLDTNDPTLVEKGLQYMLKFQAGSQGNEWLYAIGGFAASKLLDRR